MAERTFVQFQAGQSVYGLPVTSVIEIIRLVALSPVPDPTPDLLGMINLRGRVIPVFDLCRSLQGEQRPLSLRMYIVIADVGGEALGVVVDDVLDVVTIQDDQFQVSRALGGSNAFAAGIARIGAEMLTILNFSPLLDRVPSDVGGAEP
jgi:purine-binding chemotaxis protein CheW